MTNKKLGLDYYKRAFIRFKLVNFFMQEEDYADVVRVCQEVVELCQKAILIMIGINPPKWHDVIDIIIENREKIPEHIFKEILGLRKDTKWLRSQREISFYGSDDFIPTTEYSISDANKAIEIAQKFIKITQNFI